MTMKVLDQVDILEENLRYHISQGVDFVVAHDNGSTDGSRSILDRYREAGLLALLDEPPSNFAATAAGLHTRMARLAATKYDADWVITSDPDEFWWPVTGTLTDVLTAVPASYSVLTAPRSEFLPAPDGPRSFAERMIVREARSHTTPKVAHRAAADIVTSDGVHRVAGEGETPDGIIGATRLSLAKWKNPILAPRFVPQPHWPVRILHFPVRSRAQFLRRMDLFAADEGWSLSRRTREVVRQQQAPGFYDSLLSSDFLSAGLREHRFVKDTRLRDFLRGLPDPVVAGVSAARSYARRASADLNPQDLQTELATLALDVMEATARKEIKKLRRTDRLEKLRNELNAEGVRATSLKQRNRELKERNRQLQEPWWGQWRSPVARLTLILKRRVQDSG